MSMLWKFESFSCNGEVAEARAARASHASDPAPLTGSFPKADGSGRWPETRFTLGWGDVVFCSIGPTALS